MEQPDTNKQEVSCRIYKTHDTSSPYMLCKKDGTGFNPYGRRFSLKGLFNYLRNEHLMHKSISHIDYDKSDKILDDIVSEATLPKGEPLPNQNRSYVRMQGMLGF